MILKTGTLDYNKGIFGERKFNLAEKIGPFCQIDQRKSGSSDNPDRWFSSVKFSVTFIIRILNNWNATILSSWFVNQLLGGMLVVIFFYEYLDHQNLFWSYHNAWKISHFNPILFQITLKPEC